MGVHRTYAGTTEPAPPLHETKQAASRDGEAARSPARPEGACGDEVGSALAGETGHLERDAEAALIGIDRDEPADLVDVDGGGAGRAGRFIGLPPSVFETLRRGPADLDLYD